uniref:Uncharacterized protein n=1 Tax=Physcomitrium patens TaxID=3218 RepID=A0A2K1KEM4_PHYPA|nr:hypothetical protein PHYPA_008598 [Physcomitrium patens]
MKEEMDSIIKNETWTLKELLEKKYIDMTKRDFDANLYYMHKDGYIIILMLYIENLFMTPRL